MLTLVSCEVHPDEGHLTFKLNEYYYGIITGSSLLLLRQHYYSYFLNVRLKALLFDT